MKHYEDRPVPRRVVVRVECDSCRKRADGDEPKGWISFTTSHSDWGNDSVESYDEHDACSAACFVALLSQEVNGYEMRLSGEPTLNINVSMFGLEFGRDLLDEWRKARE